MAPLDPSIECDGNCNHIATPECCDADRMMFRIRLDYPGNRGISANNLPPKLLDLLDTINYVGEDAPGKVAGFCYLCGHCMAALLGESLTSST